MNTRFYAGPINSGMGQRWDDWRAPEAGVESARRRCRASIAPPKPRVGLPRAPSPDARHPRIDPIAPRR